MSRNAGPAFFNKAWDGLDSLYDLYTRAYALGMTVTSNTDFRAAHSHLVSAINLITSAAATLRAEVARQRAVTDGTAVDPALVRAAAQMSLRRETVPMRRMPELFAHFGQKIAYNTLCKNYRKMISDYGFPSPRRRRPLEFCLSEVIDWLESDGFCKWSAGRNGTDNCDSPL